MNTEILGIVAMFVLTVLLALPLGRYMAKVFSNEPTFLDPIFNPIERAFFKISGIDASQEQTWKQQMVSMLTINFVWFLLGMLILMNQGSLPLNPDNNPSQSAHLAFNTTISFLVNCNLQHYSGESGLSYLGQLFLMFLQFVSAATGIAAAVTLFYALRKGSYEKLGNFYNFFLKSATRVLLPICIIFATILLLNGTPMTMEGKGQMITMQGDTTQVSTGPVAAFVAIKHLGTNGGGFYGANSAHPLENPNYLTNMVEMVSQMLIPFAMIFALGYFLNRKKLAWSIFAVMTIGFLLLTIPTVYNEMNGNPNIAKMGIDNSLGAMEGKEVRFGAPASAYWSIGTTVISTDRKSTRLNSSHSTLSRMPSSA